MRISQGCLWAVEHDSSGRGLLPPRSNSCQFNQLSVARSKYTLGRHFVIIYLHLDAFHVFSEATDEGDLFILIQDHAQECGFLRFV